MNATVTDWSAGFISGVAAGISKFFSALPNIIGALLILIIGWIIAGVIGSLVTRLAQAIRVDVVADKVGINTFLQRSGTSLRASGIFGEILKWVIRLVFVEMAAEQIGMPQVTAIINQILAFIPNIVVAIVILGVGAFVGQMLGGLVRGFSSEAGVGNPELLAKLTNVAILAFAAIAALNQLQIAPVVVNTLYIGLVSAIALALGLSFGLGGRETAGRLTDRWVGQMENMTQVRPKMTTGTTGTSASTVVSSPSDTGLVR